jgi:hypothetical protein
MKSKLFFLAILSFFALCSCNKEKITLNIVSPKDGAVFSKNASIEVNINATTQKGHITQVILFVDTLTTYYSTEAPYDFIIPENTFLEKGWYSLSAMAYSSEGVQEGDGIYIEITK